MQSKLRHGAAAALAAVLGACAIPLQPDLAARAPDLPGYGQVEWIVSTASPAAQRLYTRGVLQAYAFNEVEAVRMFKAALAQDPRCAMCAWGVAWQLGPNINNTSRSDVKEALRYLDHALRHSASTSASTSPSPTATAQERALIEAMALRYGHASQARETAPLTAPRCGPKSASSDDDDDEDDPVHPLDAAYAARLLQLVQATPADANLLSLYAEAEMVATRSEWWNDTTGQPGGLIGELATRLEQALKRQPDHIGLNHYMIHAADSATAAQRAVPAAERLGRLAPASPHLVHMPSHIFVRVGRYADAARVNEEAVAADLTLMAAQKTQGFSVSKDWRNHDQSFLWYAALMQGRGDVAVAAARDIASRAKGPHALGEYRRSLPMLALLRLERWDALAREPMPDGSLGMAQALGAGARGVGLVRSGRMADAQAALAQADAGAAVIAKAHTKPKGFDRMLREMTATTTERLRAEIASAQGRHADALLLQMKAVTAAKRADNNEPPMLAAGARVALGELQLRAGRPAAAEKTFREDLVAQPGSGWALSGLVRALDAQGRAADAALIQPALLQAWSQADASLRPMR